LELVGLDRSPSVQIERSEPTRVAALA
jgi:hypothetical protein